MYCPVLRERGRCLGLRLKSREEKLRKGKRGEACCGATDVFDECFQRMPSANVFDDYLTTQFSQR